MSRKATERSVYQIYHTLPIIRKLEIEAFAVLCLVFLGSIIFHHVEDWRYLDAAYFTTTTLATVGYGDFVPRTDLGKGVTMIYQMLGIPIFLYAGSLLIERRIEERLRRIKRMKASGSSDSPETHHE